MTDNVSSNEIAISRSTWRFGHIALAIILSYFMNIANICMCNDPKNEFCISMHGFIFIGVIARSLLAWVIKERNKGWIFYVAFTSTSPIWIRAIYELIGRPILTRYYYG